MPGPGGGSRGGGGSHGGGFGGRSSGGGMHGGRPPGGGMHGGMPPGGGYYGGGPHRPPHGGWYHRPPRRGGGCVFNLLGIIIFAIIMIFFLFSSLSSCIVSTFTGTSEHTENQYVEEYYGDDGYNSAEYDENTFQDYADEQ